MKERTTLIKKLERFRVSESRRKSKLKAIAYKGGCCERCSYDRCPAALVFHHIDPKTKDFGISSDGMIRSFEKIKSELDKCILLCQNCHAEIHYEESEKERAFKAAELAAEKTKASRDGNAPPYES